MKVAVRNKTENGKK